MPLELLLPLIDGVPVLPLLLLLSFLRALLVELFGKLPTEPDKLLFLLADAVFPFRFLAWNKRRKNTCFGGPLTQADINFRTILLGLRK